jgi:kynurenine formamidase
MEFKEIGRRLSNWGRWGEGDRVGTLNHLTPERVKAAAASIRSGEMLSLSLPLGNTGPQMGMGGRINPVHTMSMTPADFAAHPKGMVFADDFIFMPLQAATQWDGLAHVGYDGQMYNGVSAATVAPRGGSSDLSIEHVAQHGIAGRGVLLDVARHLGVDRLDAGQEITRAVLEATARDQDTAVLPGDIVMVRTGWMRCFTVDGDAPRYWNGEPGLGLDCCGWLHGNEIAAVASDNWGVEVMQPDAKGHATDVHAVLIRDMGMTLGELFVLDELAQACEARGEWTFFFTAPALRVIGGVGSPVTPLAIL